MGLVYGVPHHATSKKIKKVIPHIHENGCKQLMFNDFSSTVVEGQNQHLCATFLGQIQTL
jgi:hypothetical protein